MIHPLNVCRESENEIESITSLPNLIKGKENVTFLFTDHSSKFRMRQIYSQFCLQSTINQQSILIVIISI